MTGWGCQGCPDLKRSNRPVRTRMPGGVAGVPPTMEAPYADVLRRIAMVSAKDLRKTLMTIRFIAKTQPATTPNSLH